MVSLEFPYILVLHCPVEQVPDPCQLHAHHRQDRVQVQTLKSVVTCEAMKIVNTVHLSGTDYMLEFLFKSMNCYYVDLGHRR